MIRWISTRETGILATLVGFSQGLSERREMYGVSKADGDMAA
jgi:hypothetical protein